MSRTLQRHFDGSFARPVQQGPCVTSIDLTHKARTYLYRFWQDAEKYAQDYAAGRGMQLSAQDRHGAFLVEQSDPREIGGGLVEFTRLFAHVPGTRVEPEDFNYGYQFLTGGTVLSEVSLQVSSLVTYRYVHTLSPQLILKQRAYRILNIAGSLLPVGTPPAVDALYFLAEDESLDRWKGNIWQLKHREVPTTIRIDIA